MKRFIYFALILFVCLSFVACKDNRQTSAIELMGAGDRIHDSFTFANSGVELSDDGDNRYTISGSVQKLNDKAVKSEFGIDEDVSHVVAIKLSAMGENVVSEEVEITVDGLRAYDAEHLNGSNYTFIILDAVASRTLTIKVKWNNKMQQKSYVIHFADNLELL